MKRISIFLLFTLAIVNISCAAKSAPAAMPLQESYMEKAVDSPAAPAVMAGEAEYNDQTITLNTSVEQTERIVIKNGSLSIVVIDPADTMAEIVRMAEGMGGFVVTSEMRKIQTEEGLEVPEATISVRIPADKMTEGMEKIKSMVKNPDTDILNENVSGQDVTKEYTDLKSRLTNLENARDRLEIIMDEAVKTEDVLNVYNQLTTVTEQIEVIKGEIKYYEESATYSSISVTIRSEASIAPLTVGGWKPQGVARNALQALINLLKFIGSVTIWLIIFFIPLGLFIFIPLYILFRIIRYFSRKQKGSKAKAERKDPPLAPKE